MKIYIAHARSFDFQQDLYAPIQRSSLFHKHQFVLPHAGAGQVHTSSKGIIESCDCLIAEVSHPSTGMGIEIGWAHAANIPVYAMYRRDCTPTNALAAVTKQLYPYDDVIDTLQKILEP
jgi:nucleoside 2-deoxyribosyltransferase